MQSHLQQTLEGRHAMLREEYRQRLIGEYRYAITKMQEATLPAKKLFYFSVIFGEAQRILNWEWNTELALIHQITNHLHTQFNVNTQAINTQGLSVELRMKV